jgi:tetratricopeptide (TPR) repeat protein
MPSVQECQRSSLGGKGFGSRHTIIATLLSYVRVTVRISRGMISNRLLRLKRTRHLGWGEWLCFTCASGESVRSMKIYSRPTGFSAATSLCCLGLLLLFQDSSGNHLQAWAKAPSRERLVAVLGLCRPFEARLTGGFSHIAYQSSRSHCRISPEARSVVREAEEADKSAQGLADTGFIALLDGDTDRAISRFEEAVAREPGNPLFLNDLAAAYITRALHEGQPPDLLHAFSKVKQALRLRPTLPEARFNLAFVLDQLSLPERAQESWQEYLRLEQDPGWSGEGRARLESLQLGSTQAWSEENQQALVRASTTGDEAEVRRIVERYRRSARALVEEDLLPKWALLVSKNLQAEAVETLRASRSIAGALAVVTDDFFLRDVVNHIDQEQSRPASCIKF